MVELNLRDLEDRLVAELRRHAAIHGSSVAQGRTLFCALRLVWRWSKNRGLARASPHGSLALDCATMKRFRSYEATRESLRHCTDRHSAMTMFVPLGARRMGITKQKALR
jgi:hypothetical protein